MDLPAGFAFTLVGIAVAGLGSIWVTIIRQAAPAGLRECPSCHASVATSATTCPKCGRKFSSVGGVVLLLLLVLIALGIWRLVR